MKKKRRSVESCELVVEQFLKENPRFSASDGWYLMWCRMNNGGDPPYYLGPFKEDQLYLSFSELVTVYPQAGLSLMMTPDVNTSELFFVVLWGSLLALKKDDGEDLGWIYFEGAWVRVGSGQSKQTQQKQEEHSMQEMEIAEPEQEHARSEYMEMLFHVKLFDGDTIVVLCPKKHFEEEECCGDSEYQLEFDAALAGVEDQFDELTDGTYAFEGSVEEATALLEKIGMKRDARFDQFMEHADQL